jgi:CBS domain-containing protein
MFVEHVMSEDPVCVTPEMSLQQAARLMVEHDCGALPVIQPDGSGQPLGIITDRDITCRTVAVGKNPLEMRVSDAMTTPAVTVPRDASVDECREQMEEGQVRRMLVVDEQGRICGIVAQADIARHTGDEDAAELVREVSAEPASSPTLH